MRQFSLAEAETTADTGFLSLLPFVTLNCNLWRVTLCVFWISPVILILFIFCYGTKEEEEAY